MVLENEINKYYIKHMKNHIEEAIGQGIHTVEGVLDTKTQTDERSEETCGFGEKSCKIDFPVLNTVFEPIEIVGYKSPAHIWCKD